MTGRNVDYSVVLPCYNEEGCVAGLTAEVEQVLAALGRPSEVLLVDDASTDRTLEVMREQQKKYDNVRVLRHTVNCGQSAASATGFRAARGQIVIVMDGDGQNDPSDIPRLLAALDGADAVCGVRARRHDSWLRRVSSRIGNGYRNLITGDKVRDSGCALRAIRAPALRELPVFNGMHRFLPTLLRYQGFRVLEIEVSHRPRRAGQSKYGIRNRMVRGMIDCFAMRWWRRRAVRGQRVVAESEERG
jgi:glycosyltransferase involved in cell wall biosynthesis